MIEKQQAGNYSGLVNMLICAVALTCNHPDVNAGLRG